MLSFVSSCGISGIEGFAVSVEVNLSHGIVLFEIVGLADRAVILREGHIIGEIPKEGITENSLLMAANGKGEYVNG